ncbi:MAG TPA: tyrosinase family protein [Stellaceae bacterium]|jgi:tyrosinase|nr:tyrosinase family protein [Stellaceae bacterium]
MAQSRAVPRPESRYTRVKAILAGAAGDSGSDYGGLGAFWELPLGELIEAKVFGIRLIAPAMQASCCNDGDSRSAASGLIRALRGAPPFDGNRFPPFMWGGSRVAPTEIDFIAEWIDTGCAADDGGYAPLDITTREVTRARVIDLEFDVAKGSSRRYPYREGEPRQRANLDCLSEPEVEALRDSFRQIYDLNPFEDDRRSYNNQALIHQNHCQHGWERFLPWHRAYLYEFEQNLQDFVRDITVPYWDWTMPQYRPHDPTSGWVIPQAFQAFLTGAQVEAMIAALDPAPTAAQAKAFRALAEPRRYFTSQHAFFCCVINTIGYTDVTPDPSNANRQAMIYALMMSNSLWYPLRYPAEYIGGKTINERIHYHYPTAEDMQQILNLNNFRDFGGGNVYNASFGYLDQNPHNTMHIWTGGQNPEYADPNSFRLAYVCDDAAASGAAPAVDGELLAARRNFAATVKDRKFHSKSDLYSQPSVGDMFSNLTASYDPVFWPVHVNVDRTWWEWQTKNPTGLPYDLDSILSPWNYTIRDMLDISRFGYEYVRCSFFMPVGMEAPIGRFVSAPIKIDPKAKSFNKAEIRMHWVPQLMRSCFVRAFLNQPGANASTPVRDNPHYAGYLAIFGHGECYGGPGHCDLPPARSRPFDQRSRNHNTPRNHRLDVTAAARRMLEVGDELQITLLVIGVDYREDNDLLRLEGVSLNLLD